MNSYSSLKYISLLLNVCVNLLNVWYRDSGSMRRGYSATGIPGAPAPVSNVANRASVGSTPPKRISTKVETVDKDRTYFPETWLWHLFQITFVNGGVLLFVTKLKYR